MRAGVRCKHLNENSNAKRIAQNVFAVIAGERCLLLETRDDRFSTEKLKKLDSSSYFRACFNIKFKEKGQKNDIKFDHRTV